MLGLAIYIALVAMFMAWPVTLFVRGLIVDHNGTRELDESLDRLAAEVERAIGECDRQIELLKLEKFAREELAGADREWLMRQAKLLRPRRD